MSRGGICLTCLLTNIAWDILLFTWAKCFCHVYWNSKKLNWWISAIISNSIKWCSIYQRAVNYKAAREHWKLTCWHKTSYTVYLSLCLQYHKECPNWGWIHIMWYRQQKMGYYFHRTCCFHLHKWEKARVQEWNLRGTPLDMYWWEDFMVSISTNCDL